MERWRELIDERLAEAVGSLGAVPDVRGLVVGGSVGRGEPWPLSDIDLLPIVRMATDPGAEIRHRHAVLIDWWAASGRAQTLDVGWLSFTDAEVEQTVRSGAVFAAGKMAEPRWLHGMDKAFGGYGAGDPDGLAQRFAEWATHVRFAPAVVAGRIREWTGQAVQSRDRALQAAAQGDRSQATLDLRRSACALRLVLVEGWGERLGSMGREWTRFERMARRHGATDLAAQCADLAGAAVRDAVARAQQAPAWLRERIDLAYQARLSVGEEVTEGESVRDQVAAFAVHVTRRQPEPWAGWMGMPDPHLERKLDDLEHLIRQHCSVSTLD